MEWRKKFFLLQKSAHFLACLFSLRKRDRDVSVVTLFLYSFCREHSGEKRENAGKKKKKSLRLFPLSAQTHDKEKGGKGYQSSWMRACVKEGTLSTDSCCLSDSRVPNVKAG